jgi:hypothetical protein
MSNRLELVRQLVALSRTTFFLKIKAVRTYVCDGYVISGNKAFIVYRIDADHAEWGTLNMSEVAIQERSNGKVVREKFVY